MHLATRLKARLHPCPGWLERVYPSRQWVDQNHAEWWQKDSRVSIVPTGHPGSAPPDRWEDATCWSGVAWHALPIWSSIICSLHETQTTYSRGYGRACAASDRGSNQG
jgi:hypothetical protein